MRQFAVICVLLMVLPQSGRAQFAVCNQTLDVMNVSVGYFDVTEFTSEGWWTVGPNQCANVIPDRLVARYIYVFAQDAFGKAIVTGEKTLCVAPERFRISGEQDCLIRGYLDAPFHEVDTQRTERWTLYIVPPDG